MKIQIRQLTVFLFLVIFSPSCSRYPPGTLVFVTNERDRTISAINTRTDKVIDTIFTGARPSGIRMSADGRNAYVALSTPMNKEPRPEDNKIVVIDTQTGTTTKSINVASDPEQLAVNADQTY